MCKLREGGNIVSSTQRRLKSSLAPLEKPTGLCLVRWEGSRYLSPSGKQKYCVMSLQKAAVVCHLKEGTG